MCEKKNISKADIRF